MEESRAVNIWFDRPGDFLEIGWSKCRSFDSSVPPDLELGIEFHLTDDNEVTGFYGLGAPLFSDSCSSKSTVVAHVRPHPVTAKYDRATDLWDVPWAPGPVECV